MHSKLPSKLSNDIKRFEQDLSHFRDGSLHETAFTAKRVKMGVYLERNFRTHMCRIRCAGNIITPKQLAQVASLAQEYGHHWVHVTTRAEVQIHHLELDNISAIFRDLQKTGLSSKGGGGHTVRNILTNHDSGIHPDEVFDVQPYARALTGRMLDEVDSFELPRKLKISFSSLSTDAALSVFNDLGFIACVNELGEKGFKVLVGGGLGAKPKQGIPIHEFIPEDKVYHVTKAVKEVFHQYGNRRNKHHSRIRFLIHDDLGIKRFQELYRAELGKIAGDNSLKLEIQEIDNGANLNRQFDLEAITDHFDCYNLWENRHVSAQKQRGLFSIKLPLHLGDLDVEDCLKLEKLLQPFGENVLRCCNDQNLHIRNIPERYLKNIYKGLMNFRSLSNSPAFLGRVVPCTGAQTCQVGINYPRPATTAIFKYFEKVGLDLEKLGDIRIHISGCPNSCANHWISDLGFYGRVRRISGRPTPTYNIVGGAKTGIEKPEFAQEVAWVHSRDLAPFLTDVFNDFNAKQAKEKNLDFYTYWHNGGKTWISDLCKERYNDIPTFENDKNYYFDHGADQLFSIKDMGKAECSAGIYDMINVDDRAIKKNLIDLDKWDGEEEALMSKIKETLFYASRMLLVTRGEDPKTEKESLQIFSKHFIETNLVDARYRSLIEMAIDKDEAGLIENRDLIISLGKAITELYKGMDDTMKFPGETENLAIRMEEKAFGDLSETGAEKTSETFNISEFKDLRGVKCPINFAQTKVQMASMSKGELLEIFLDDGEPISNVPGSVKLEGHIIHAQEWKGDYWRVVIEKV